MQVQVGKQFIPIMHIILVGNILLIKIKGGVQEEPKMPG